MPVVSTFDASDYYWFVGGHPADEGTKLFSSARAAYVQRDDADFAAWMEADGNPYLAASPTALAKILADAGLPPETVRAAASIAPVDEQRDLLLDIGVQITSTGTPALNGRYAADLVAQLFMTEIYCGIVGDNSVPGGGLTFNFYDMDGVAHTFDYKMFRDFYQAMRDKIYEVAQQSHAVPPVWPTMAATIP